MERWGARLAIRSDQGRHCNPQRTPRLQADCGLSRCAGANCYQCIRDGNPENIPTGDVSLNVKSLSITGNQVATQGDLTSGINGLQIGSRNYLLNSEKTYTNQSREFLQTHDLAPIFDTYGLGVWTLSFDLKSAKATGLKCIAKMGTIFDTTLEKTQFRLQRLLKGTALRLFRMYMHQMCKNQCLLFFFRV